MMNLVAHDKQIVLCILNKRFLWHFLEYLKDAVTHMIISMLLHSCHVRNLAFFLLRYKSRSSTWLKSSESYGSTHFNRHSALPEHQVNRWLKILWYDMVWYNIIWYDIYVMIWCDVMWCDMIWYGMIWYDMIYDMTWCYMIWYDMIWYDMIWYDTIWYDTIWYDMIDDMIWYDMIR